MRGENMENFQHNIAGNDKFAYQPFYCILNFNLKCCKIFYYFVRTNVLYCFYFFTLLLFTRDLWDGWCFTTKSKLLLGTLGSALLEFARKCLWNI